MKCIPHRPGVVLLSLAPGEEVMGALTTYMAQEKLPSATCTIIGAAREVELGYYHPTKREYHMSTRTGIIEIVSGIGNIAWKDGAPIVHVHAVCADETLTPFAGHIKRMVISGACEIVLTQGEHSFGRRYDEETGLSLLCDGAGVAG